jgi:hypothetical protein
MQLSSWRWAQCCSKYVEDSNKNITDEIVRLVGHLTESKDKCRLYAANLFVEHF